MKSKGFTLIELMIVIVSILAIIAVSAYQEHEAKAGKEQVANSQSAEVK